MKTNKADGHCGLVGKTFTFDDNLGHEQYRHVKIVHDHGPARLFQGRMPDGREGVVAITPDDGWWLVRPFEAPQIQ